jgi:4-deoxy-L-threo-5-hexosulose-uronate ketol-isomerase
MRVLQMADEVRYPCMSTTELRNTFLLGDLFEPDRVKLVYVDLDRTVIGSAVPLGSALELPCPEELRATAFTERRELGVFNIGGPGAVRVDGEGHALGNRDALYIGKGEHRVAFTSNSPMQPAEFYLLSYPAHSVHPTAVVRANKETPLPLGEAATANRRKITKLFIWRA